MNETKYCQNCGAEIDRKAIVCPACGVQQAKMIDKKNPGLAAVLSFFIIGSGQIYNGDIGKGLLLIGLQISNGMLLVITMFAWIPLFIVFTLILFGYSIYDAYNKATEINDGI